jgi:hypothetical protein
MFSTGAWTLGRATNEPARLRRTISPASTRAAMALLTVMRAQPYWVINSVSNGTRWPGSHSPERMRASMSERMRWCRGSVTGRPRRL